MTTLPTPAPASPHFDGPTARIASSGDLDVASCLALLDQPGTILVDCRERDEHARERIPGAVLMPLGTLDPERIRELGASRVVIHCKSGRRGADATARCIAAGLDARNMRGGIEAWRTAGLGTELDASRPRMSVMQQSQITIGTAVVAGTALGFFLNPWFLTLPAFMGCGMIFAGATGACGLASVIDFAPWNRANKCGAGTCANR